jgi:hypothetical protein
VTEQCQTIERGRWKERSPFLPCGHTPHAVHPVENSLQARQNGPVELDWERALESRLVLCLFQKFLEFYELYLEMELPARRQRVSWRVSMQTKRRTLP